MGPIASFLVWLLGKCPSVNNIRTTQQESSPDLDDFELNDFDPEDESVQFWLDSLSEEPLTHSNTCAYLDRCLALPQPDGSHSQNC